ncbi:MAG TPA: FGGY family carbohydrate kinase [Gammaproteobacteria bacterium]
MTDTLTLAIDVGTHTTRALVSDADGNVLAHAQRENYTLRPATGHVEQDGKDIINSIYAVVESVTSRIHGIKQAGMAIQRSSVIAWDRYTGHPLSPVLSWQDTRAANSVAALDRHADDIKSRSGLVLTPFYGASKLNWLLQNDPEVAASREDERLCIGPLASYVLFKLLAKKPYLVDESNAARTQLWNLQARAWDTRLCELFDIPQSLLPEVLPTCAHYGRVIDTSIPLTAVCGDQNAAFYSIGNLPAETAFINLGTGAFILSPTGQTPKPHPRLLTTLAFSNPDRVQYMLEATVNGAGSALQWARQRWRIADLHGVLPGWLREIDNPPVFLNTIGGLGSPWWRSGLEPRFVDMQPDSENNPALCVTAIVESIAFMLMHNLETLKQAGQSCTQCMVSGGLASLDGLCQKLANLTTMPVLRLATREATALGAALLASSLPPAEPVIEHRFEPKPDPGLTQRYNRFLEGLRDLIR